MNEKEPNILNTKEIEVTLEQITDWKKENVVYIDTRGAIAYQHGHIENAQVFENMDVVKEQIPLQKDKKYIVYCTYGETSYEIAQELREMGYDAYNLKGGYRSWLLKHTSGYSREELLRYDRQIILPQIGMDGQLKLKNAKVLIIGAGGLGAPAALYLAGAGVGTIGLMDADAVSMSNLQRQIIFSESMVDQNKAESAKQVLEHLNSGIQVKAYKEFITPQNAEEIIAEYDFVIDAVDNFEAKFLINDACVLAGKPFCHAGILRFQGQVMTYVPDGKYTCYRCIFEEIPEPSSVQNCSQAGVIGAMAGIIGSVQALEAVKYFTGAGELLTNKMYVFDGLTMENRIVRFPNRNERCRVCGENADIKSVKGNAAEYRRKGCAIQSM